MPQKITVLALLFVVNVLFAPTSVFAAAWWGDGYKPEPWVLANGGTIINVTIQGSKPNNYKAFLRQNGKYVEVEFSKNMTFDDAKNGAYTITFYNCNRDCRYQETQDKTKLRGNDAEKLTIPVTAIPGQRVRITYNTDSNTVAMQGGGARPAVKKKTWAETVVEKAQKTKGEYCLLPFHDHDTQKPVSQAKSLTSQNSLLTTLF